MAKWAPVSATEEKPRTRWAPVEAASASQPVEDPMPPYDLTSDIGPGSDPGPRSAMDPNTRGMLEKADAQWEGLTDAIPGARDLHAAVFGALPQAGREVGTAMAGYPPSWQRVLEEYRATKQAGIDRAAASREAHPGDYWTSNLMGAAGAGIATAGAGAAAGPALARGLGVDAILAKKAAETGLPLAQRLGQGAAELGTLLGQAENYGDAGGGDALAAHFGGKLIGGTLGAGVKAIKWVGEALQVPLRAAEELFYRFGPTKLAKMMNGSDPTPEGKAISARVQELRGKISAADTFKGKPGPEIPIRNARDANAFSLAQDVEHGAAEFGPGPGDFTSDPALWGDLGDDAARESVRVSNPAALKTPEMLKAELQGKKATDARTVGELLDDAKEPLLGAESRLRQLRREGAGIDAAAQDSLGDHSVLAPPAPAPPPLPTRGKMWRQLLDASGIDSPSDFTAADSAYEAYRVGKGPKPGPWEGGELDAINEELGLRGKRRVSGAREAFDHVMSGVSSWEEAAEKLPLLRKIPGLEKLRLPDHIQDALLPIDNRSASFAFGMNDPAFRKFAAEEDMIARGVARRPAPSADDLVKMPRDKFKKLVAGGVDDLKMYRGTSDGARGDGPQWFTSSPEGARSYAKQSAGSTGGAEQIVEDRISMRRPYVASASEMINATNETIARLQAEGYDGMISQWSHAFDPKKAQIYAVRFPKASRFDWPNEPIGKNGRAAVTDPRRHLRWETPGDEAEQAQVWEDFADDSMGMGEANARHRIGEDSRPVVDPRAPEYVAPGEEAAAPLFEQAKANEAALEAEIKQRRRAWDEGAKVFGRDMQADREAFVKKARQYQQLLQQAKAVEGENRMEAERLRGIADEARAELEQMQRGRMAIEKLMGGLSGGAAGYGAANASGIPFAGIGGAAAGWKAGAKQGVPVALGAEAASAAGQKLTAWAAANADKWATRGDALGRVAQWALSAGGAGDGLRLYMLARAAQDIGEQGSD